MSQTRASECLLNRNRTSNRSFGNFGSWCIVSFRDTPSYLAGATNTIRFFVVSLSVRTTGKKGKYIFPFGSFAATLRIQSSTYPSMFFVYVFTISVSLFNLFWVFCSLRLATSQLFGTLGVSSFYGIEAWYRSFRNLSNSSTLFNVICSSHVKHILLSTVPTVLISQNIWSVQSIFSSLLSFRTKYLWANSVCPPTFTSEFRFPIQVRPRDVCLATGCPGSPQTSI